MNEPGDVIGTLELPGPKTTLAVLVLDRSASMAKHREQVVSGVNEWLASLRQPVEDDRVLLRLVLFADVRKTHYRDVPIEHVEDLGDDYQPTGPSTALNDAVGLTLQELEAEGVTADRVLFVVQTDGLENSSKAWPGADGKVKIRELLEARKATGRWTVVFMGADIDAFAEAGSLGVGAQNVKAYAAAQTVGAYSHLAMATTSYRGSSRAATQAFWGGSSGSGGTDEP